MWHHYVVRACQPYRPFEDYEIARWTWKMIGKLIPEALSCILMPNHIHMIIPTSPKPDHPKFSSSDEISQPSATNSQNFSNNRMTPISQKLFGLLGPISQKMAKQRLWQPIPPPSLIPDFKHLGRQLRYLPLNPCRARLCQDPLEWYWSTYHEVMGASAQKLQYHPDWSKILFASEANFRVRLHAYVSADPSVRVAGTPAPRAAIPSQRANYGIGEILEASAEALLLDPSEVTSKRTPLRKFFLHFAFHHGWKQTSRLAEICELSSRGVCSALSGATGPGMSAGDLCLGDPRLRLPVRKVPSEKW